jgi:hypothetical protein
VEAFVSCVDGQKLGANQIIARREARKVCAAVSCCLVEKQLRDAILGRARDFYVYAGQWHSRM